MVIRWLVLGLAGMLPLASAGQGPELTPEDLAWVQEELAKAGVPLTGRETGELLDASSAPNPTENQKKPWGMLRLRWARTGSGIQDGDLRLELRRSDWRSALRVRRYGDGTGYRTGAVARQGRGIVVAVGSLGVSHGHGLLVAAPGFGGSLTADQTWAPGRSGVRPWLGATEPRMILGTGIGYAGDRWSLGAVHGRTGKQGDQDVSILHFGAGGAGYRFGSDLVGVRVRDHLGFGGSMHADVPPLRVHLTAAGWNRPGSPLIQGAALLELRAEPRRGVGIEGGVGMSRADSPFPLASRPGLLPGWNGQGIGGRVFLRVEKGWLFRFLAIRSRWVDVGAVRRSKHRALLEFQFEKSLADRWDLVGRLRNKIEETYVWSDRYPWRPAELDDRDGQTMLSLLLEGDYPESRFRLGYRTLGRQRGWDRERRHLVTLEWRRRLQAGWQLRFHQGMAWGQDLDLVSAVAPMTGLVLPRHWGRWSREILVGIEGPLGPVRWRSAVSIRRATPERGGHFDRHVWVAAETRW